MTTRQDLTIRQGETWSWTYTKKDSAGAAVDLTGYTARMAIKSCIDGNLEAYLSTGADADGGTITLGGVLGTVVLSMTATESAAMAGALGSLMAWLDGKSTEGPVVTYLYDLELVSGAGAVTRELEGRVFIHRQVTA